MDKIKHNRYSFYLLMPRSVEPLICKVCLLVIVQSNIQLCSTFGEDKKGEVFEEIQFMLRGKMIHHAATMCMFLINEWQ